MKKNDPAIGRVRVRGAKGAAQEAIGKLIGDDAEIRKGRDEQSAAKAAAGSINRKQE